MQNIFSSQGGSLVYLLKQYLSPPFTHPPRGKPLFWLSALYLNLACFWHCISGIMYVLFYVLLLSLSIMLWGFLHVVACSRSSLLFSVQFLCGIPLYEYNTIYPFCWQYLAVIYKAILNILIHVFWWICALTHLMCIAKK